MKDGKQDKIIDDSHWDIYVVPTIFAIASDPENSDWIDLMSQDCIIHLSVEVPAVSLVWSFPKVQISRISLLSLLIRDP